MTTDPHTLAAAYALGALDPEERADFEAHLASCSSCSAEIAEFRGVVESLADADAVAPPTALRASVLDRLDDHEQVPRRATAATEPVADAPVVDLAERRRRRFSVASALAAAAAVAVLAIGAIVVSSLRGGGTNFDDVRAASDAVVTELEGETGTVEVAYSAELDRVALRGSDVDELDPDLRYALWAITGDAAIPAGLFESDGGSIDDTVELADVQADAWGITVESAEGADAPTTDIIYFAEV